MRRSVSKPAASKPAAKIIAPPDQRFECRDCPARCCRLPWRVGLEEGEIRRYLADPWVRERAGDGGVRILERGVLPMREQDRRLQCVFLDDDGLCSVQKRSGHAAIPRSCQAFPFGFVRGEEGALVAQLSLLCPSIRDDRGEPVAGQLEEKAQQKGDAGRMAASMETLGGAALSRAQYLRVVKEWDDLLAIEGSPADALARIRDLQGAFDAALPEGAAQVTDDSVSAALTGARGQEVEPLVPRRRPSFLARVLFAVILSGLCYPARLRVPHRAGAAASPRLEGLRSFWCKLAWLLGMGTVDMLFTAAPLRLRRVARTERFLSGAEGALVRDYLRLVLSRRQVFATGQSSLAAVLVELALATAVISHFARCRAAAEGRARVTAEDVREGISVAELRVLHHAAPSGEDGILPRLRALLLASRDGFRQVLASEA